MIYISFGGLDGLDGHENKTIVYCLLFSAYEVYKLYHKSSKYIIHL